ncbi:prephenate dehydrogenase [Streptomyces sp. TRM S81-3]|uniref:Prephenate dehydrogenase n=1 Tax=Streptomyces griseicoloratus TaxID=2752516 RepID=A0A926LAB6_9ACTN|nr:prephenate dehydrogenase [Streptomyces griseicoloratus]MBD0423934.1 prephenate dehydrogenase [Streptomyces griseicoloratus]
MRSAAVIGTGAIGTSVALALTRSGVTVHLVDVNRTAAQTAEAMGAGSLSPPKEPVDVAVLAVPPAHVAAELARVQREGLARAYTDVASVKARPQQDLLAAHSADPAGYIGGHPLAGTERSGPLAARADLFEGRPWVLTPSAHTDEAVLNRALELVALCAGTPVIMDVAAHDRAVALTSHAPHLISSLMAARLSDATEASVRVCGQGLRSMTRIAGGDPALWQDILHSNAEAVADVLEAYAADLAVVVGALRTLGSADPGVRGQAEQDLRRLLVQGLRGHARVTPKPGTSLADLAAVTVAIPDRPNALAEVFAAVGETGVNIEDVRIEHAPGQGQGLVELLVHRGGAPELARLLGAGGWSVSA